MMMMMCPLCWLPLVGSSSFIAAAAAAARANQTKQERKRDTQRCTTRGKSRSVARWPMMMTMNNEQEASQQLFKKTVALDLAALFSWIHLCHCCCCFPSCRYMSCLLSPRQAKSALCTSAVDSRFLGLLHWFLREDLRFSLRCACATGSQMDYRARNGQCECKASESCPAPFAWAQIRSVQFSIRLYAVRSTSQLHQPFKSQITNHKSQIEYQDLNNNNNKNYKRFSVSILWQQQDQLIHSPESWKAFINQQEQAMCLSICVWQKTQFY